jgi:serine/threonine protein kinase
MKNPENPMSSPENREAALFAAALERPPSERAAFLDGACHGDAPLRQRLEALLSANDATDALPEPEERKPGGAPLRTIKLNLTDELPDESIGQKIGRYKILERVGEGGCGVVYVAEQTEPVRRRVALKVIKLGMDTRQVVARFEAERQALAMMDHPNIAKVLDAGTTEQGRPYFVMELVRGIRITDYCDQNQLSTKERLDLFIKACQAIQHAHQKGIIHRDIKPSNILVTLHDGIPVPKVIDFGIAKATEGRLTDATVYTQLHQFIGTPAYMSPEQAEMSGLDIDTRSDIYSLGVLLYELLAGSTPFDGNELMSRGIDAMRRTIREQEPPRPSTRFATLKGDALTTTARRRSADGAKLMHQLQGDLDWIVMKCLEKDRTRRYETANGLAADLKRHLNNEPVLARPPSKLYRFQKSFRRNKLAFAAGTAIAAALMLGIVASTWQAVRAKRAESLALQSRIDAEKLSNFMLEDFYAELEPSGRFETVAKLSKQALAYYDRLPASLRTPETERNRATAEARLALVTVQQEDFTTAKSIAEDAIGRLDQMLKYGDKSEQAAYALALALEAESFLGFRSENAQAMAIPLNHGLEVLRPFAFSNDASRQTKLLYCDLLNFLSHAQKAEQGVASCEEALRILAGLGALNLSDLDAASAWSDIADSQAREMFALGRFDEAERQERQGLKLAQGVLEQRPSDLRARRDIFFTTDLLGIIEAGKFHDAVAIDWFRQCRQASEDFTRFNPSEMIGWNSLFMSDCWIAALLFRGGQVTNALDTAWPAARRAITHDPADPVCGILWRPVAMWEAQRGDQAAAEEALEEARRWENVAASQMPDSVRNMWSEGVRDTERQTKLAFGDDTAVLKLAKDTLVLIEELNQDAVDPDTVAVLNARKRLALSDATQASLNLGRLADAETTARALLALPLLQSEFTDTMLASQPDDLGWARVLLAQAEVRQGKLAEAQQTLEPALKLYRDMQAQGVTYVTFRQRFARVLYVQSLAEPSDAGGMARCRVELNEAKKLLQGLTNEARQLHDSKELLSWIAAEQQKLGAPSL